MLEPISVSLESLNMQTLIPMLVAITGALVIIIIDLIKKDLDKTLYVMLSLLFLVIDLGSLAGLELNQRGFFDVMYIDGLSILSQIIIIVGSMLFIPLALTSKRFHEFSYPEFFALFLFMIAGFQFMVATDNLILIFVGLETASLALYTLIAMHNRKKSFEAAIKYFTMGAFSAGLYAMGSLILYALSGSVEIGQISEAIATRGYEPIGYILLATVLMLAAFGFKLALVPFHTWAPDIYEGSSAALAGYISIVPKIAAFVVVIRLFEFLANSGNDFLDYTLYAVVILTMTLSNIWALVQTDVKRMLAYSSISHSGFVMAAILIGTTQANSALFIYWILFLFTNLGAFAMLWVSRQKILKAGESNDHPFAKFQGMSKTMPVAAAMMAIFMFSLAGIPPFSLFFGKMYMISSAINAGYIVLAIIMVLNSVVAAYYYLKLIVHMYLMEPNSSENRDYMVNASMPLKTIIGVSAMITLFSIFFIDSIMEMVTNYVYVSGF